MLEVEQDFAKKVAVPAVSNLRELAVVLHESRVLNSEDVNQTISAIQERTGRDSVAVGVKSILDCIFEARAGGPNSNVVETLTDLIVEKINEVHL
jgi:vesicle-fusing ATPase